MSHIIFWLLVTFHGIETNWWKLGDFDICDLEWPWGQVCREAEVKSVIFLYNFPTFSPDQNKIFLTFTDLKWPPYLVIGKTNVKNSIPNFYKILPQGHSDDFAKIGHICEIRNCFHYRVRNSMVKFQKFSFYSIKMTTKRLETAETGFKFNFKLNFI